MTSETGGKPRIGISSCLLGDEVRYDGASKWHRVIVEIIGPQVEWIPLCPEVEVGMGIPREQVNLIGSAESPSLVAVGTGTNWSQQMKTFSRQKIQTLKRQGLNGYIFKSASPSCGLKEIKVFENKLLDQWVSSGTGMFVREFLRVFPDLPVADEEELTTERQAVEFIERIKNHHQLYRGNFARD